jgi:hypothetical protein
VKRQTRGIPDGEDEDEDGNQQRQSHWARPDKINRRIGEEEGQEKYSSRKVS